MSRKRNLNRVHRKYQLVRRAVGSKLWVVVGYYSTAQRAERRLDRIIKKFHKCDLGDYRDFATYRIEPAREIIQ